MKIKKIQILIISLALILSCAHKPVYPVSEREKSLYIFALKAHQEETSDKAEEKVKIFLKEFPASRWHASGLYILGLAQKNQGKYKEAEESLGKVVDFHQGMSVPDSVMALYHLALIYDIQGDDEKQTLALLQIAPGLKFLPAEIAEAEWPARLAAAYARRGQPIQASEYAARAEIGLKKVKSMGKLDHDKWLPKVYYSMGHIGSAALEFKNQTDLEKFLDQLSSSQPWLLMAAESGVKPWAKQASEELIMYYDKIWNFIEHMPPAPNSDSMLALKELQQRQKALVLRLDQVLGDLKSQKVTPPPDQERAPELLNLDSKLRSVQKKADILIGKKDVQDQNLKNNRSEKRQRLK